MTDDIVIIKVSKGKRQNRLTLPRTMKAEYVAVKPIEKNVFDAKRKYYK